MEAYEEEGVNELDCNCNPVARRKHSTVGSGMIEELLFAGGHGGQSGMRYCYVA